MNSRHQPVVIIVPYAVALDLLGAAEFAADVFRDQALDCQDPGRTEDVPCLEHQHDLAQETMFRIAHRYVRAALRTTREVSSRPEGGR